MTRAMAIFQINDEDEFHMVAAGGKNAAEVTLEPDLRVELGLQHDASRRDGAGMLVLTSPDIESLGPLPSTTPRGQDGSI